MVEYKIHKDISKLNLQWHCSSQEEYVSEHEKDLYCALIQTEK